MMLTKGGNQDSVKGTHISSLFWLHYIVFSVMHAGDMRYAWINFTLLLMKEDCKECIYI